MDIKRKTIVCFEIGEFEAETLATDICSLLDHTKNLPGVVRIEEAPFVIESQDRLAEFAGVLVKALKKGK